VFTVVPCLNGCGEQLFRGQLSEHLASTCARRSLQCPQCQQEVDADKMKVCDLMGISASGRFGFGSWIMALDFF